MSAPTGERHVKVQQHCHSDANRESLDRGDQWLTNADQSEQECKSFAGTTRCLGLLKVRKIVATGEHVADAGEDTAANLRIVVGVVNRGAVSLGVTKIVSGM